MSPEEARWLETQELNALQEMGEDILHRESDEVVQEIKFLAQQRTLVLATWAQGLSLHHNADLQTLLRVLKSFREPAVLEDSDS